MPSYLRLLIHNRASLSALWLLAVAVILAGWSMLSGGSDEGLRSRTLRAAEVASAELGTGLGQPGPVELQPKVRALLVRQDIGFAWLRVRDTQGYALAAAGRLESSALGRWTTSSQQRQVYSLISTEHRVPVIQDGVEVGTLEFGLLIGGVSVQGAGARLLSGVLVMMFGLVFLAFSSWRLIANLDLNAANNRRKSSGSVVEHTAATARSLPTGSGDLNAVFDRGAVLVGREHQVVDINPRAAELIGYPRENAIGKPVDQVLRLDTGVAGVAAALSIADVLKGRRQRSHEAIVLRLPDGTHASFYANVAPVKDAVGGIGAVLISLSTDNQRTERIKLAIPKAALARQPDPRQLSQMLLDQTLECVISTDSQDRIRFANDKALANLGYSLMELRSQHISKVLPEPFLRNAQMRVADYALTTADMPAPDVSVRRRDGSQYRARLSVQPVKIRERQGHVITIRPARLDPDAEGIESQLRQMIEESTDESHAIDPESLRIVASNELALKNLLFGKKVMQGMPLLKLCPQLSQDTLREKIADLQHGSTDRIEFRTRLQRADGSLYEAEASLSLWCGDSEPVLLLAVRDLSAGAKKTRSAVKEIERVTEARHDGLTGLPNRALFAERLQEAAARTDLDHHPFMLVHLSLPEASSSDHVTVQDNAVTLLKAVADRLSSVVRSSDTVARLGSSEFSLLMTGLEQGKDAHDVLKRLNMALSKPLRAGGQELVVRACMGAALYPDDANTVAQLLRHAGLALHEARLQGAGSVCLYQPQLSTPRSASQLPEVLLDEAQKRGELRVELQAISDVEAMQVVGAELLMAWHYPGKGLLHSADQVLNATHNEGLSRGLGLWALERACEQLAHWRDLELPSLPLMVNLAAMPLAGRHDAQAVRALLAQYRVPGESIIVLVRAAELEGLVTNDNRWLPVLIDFGLRLGVKDVDPGRVDLLRQADVDVVQLTPDSIAGLPGSNQASELVANVIQAAQRVGARVLATGVERVEQREALRILGCRYQQGRLLGEPQAPAALSRSLALADVGAF